MEALVVVVEAIERGGEGRVGGRKPPGLSDIFARRGLLNDHLGQCVSAVFGNVESRRLSLEMYLEERS